MNQHDQIFYHIYPLGLLGAPQHNEQGAQPIQRLDALHKWLPHMQSFGVTSLYLGPLFEASSHGYDTSDYYHVDRRLGDDAALTGFVAACHERGIRVLLDGVFHHVGRDFWAFRDVRERGEESPYRDWFSGLRFDARSPYGDPFSYDGWNGHHSLVKLNLHNADVRAHLFGAVEHWRDTFGIDGLRLDAADYIDPAFLHELSAFCRRLEPDFWLLGEVIHGDYRQWANPEMFHSVTNYAAYKGLFSSHNDGNYFEIAHTLDRQFGAGGMYRDLPLYNFADNHDVNRIASTLRNPAHLYPLHALLFTMPGVPSIYAGSEWGIGGVKLNGNDAPLRPALDLARLTDDSPQPDLLPVIQRLAALRQATPALRQGCYTQLHVAAEQFVFAREANGQRVIVAINASDASSTIDVAASGETLIDILNNGASFPITNGCVQIELPPTWARVLCEA